MHDIPAALQPGGIGWYLPAARSVLQEQQAFSDRFDDAGEAAGSHWVKARVKLVGINENVAPRDVNAAADQLAYREADLVAGLDSEDDSRPAGRARSPGR